MSDAKQVVAGGGGGQEKSSILGDIIEQQREFQRRQELRAGNLASICQAMNSSMDSQEEQQVVDRLTAINKGHGGRRKFSLSYAMSNLTSFTSQVSSGGAGVCASPAKTNRKHLQHRASLVHGQLSSGFSPLISQKEKEKESEKSVSEKKKGFMHKAIRRGSKMFDSMLLSSAQQQAAAAANLDANINATCAKRRDSSSQEVDDFENELSRVQFGSSTSSSAGAGSGFGLGVGVGVGVGAEAGVRIGAEVGTGAKVEGVEPSGEIEHKKRGRRLRLGSIPHDLRRALSLSNNAHFHRKSSKQHDAESAANISASLGSQLGLNPAKAAAATSVNTNPLLTSNATPSSTTNLATDNNSINLNLNLNNSNSCSTNNAFTSRAAQNLNLNSGKGSASGSAVNFNRLKRKNSLFSPLTSAGSAFYHHAHFGRHSGEPAADSHSHSQNLGSDGGQQGGGKASGIGASIGLGGIVSGARSGSGAVVGGSNAQHATSTSSQSASFTLCQDHNRTYKLIIFGSSAVGKTSLIQRFLYGLFPVTHKPTVEELHSNKYNIPELGEIYLEILDTSGTFEFPAMRRLSIEKGDAFILVYSVADSASWQEVIHLRQLILEEKLDQRANNNLANTPSTGAAGSRSGSGSGSGEERVSVSTSASASAAAASASNKNKSLNSQSRPAHLARSVLAAPSTDLDNNKPISSIYDAATRLTSSELRSSSMRTPNSGRRFSVNQPPSVGATPTKKALNAAQAVSPSSTPASMIATAITTTTTATTTNTTSIASGGGGGDDEVSASPVGRSTIAHYNSQLSKLLQQAPSSGSPSKGKLLQWQSIEEKEKEKDNPETTITTTGSISSNNNNNNNNNNATANNYEQRTDRGSRKAQAIGRSSGSSSDKSSDLEGSSPASGPDGIQLSQSSVTGAKISRTPIVVVANKCDLDTSAYQVDQDEAERLVRDQWGNSFVKCSAKEALNIDRVFKELLRQARAPEVLSQFVIDDHQQRRQSLPVLKNQLSAHHVRGLRSLYNQQQQHSQAGFTSSSSSGGHQQQECSQTRPTSSASDDSQCLIM